MTASINRSELEQQMLRVSADISRALRELLEPLTGPDPKPADIAEVLELDRTQAWRLSKLLSESDPFVALHDSPAPKGLGLIVEAAERAGAPSSAATAMRRAIAGFAGLLHEFPDGRAGLAGALASRVPKAHDAALKSAKKMVAQGMGQLLGMRAAVRYVATILVPSAGHDDLADVVAVAGYRDLRRLRMGPTPVVFSGRTYARAAGAAPGPPGPAVQTLEGGDDPDPRLRVLREFSEMSADALSLERVGEEMRLILGANSPPVNEPITVFFGQRVARSLARARSADPDGKRYELVHHAPVLPSDVNVFDTFVHRSLYPEADPPQVTVERFGFNPVVQSRVPDDASYRVEEPPEPKPLGCGLSRSTLRSVPRLSELLTDVFGRIGFDPGEFRLYRTTLEHVPPGFAVVMWLELPATP